MLVASIILADRKSYSQLTALPALGICPEIDRIYINIQTDAKPLYDLLRSYVKNTIEKPCHIDYWNWENSWMPEIKYDQHQARLPGIVTARNMCIDYALIHGADHLLFIDSDVSINPKGVKLLLDMNKNLSGGYVPGRGAHGHAHYVFGAKRGAHQIGEVIECDHGTAGYMLISQKVFSRLRFRYGDDPETEGQFLSEDPAYCLDWYAHTRERFYIHRGATAHHIDNPRRPLDADGAAQDTWNSIQKR